MKLTCQTKIYSGQEKIEGVRIRMSMGANAHPFAIVRRRMGSRADGNILRADGKVLHIDATWSRADGSKKSKNFGRPYFTQNLSKLGI